MGVLTLLLLEYGFGALQVEFVKVGETLVLTLLLLEYGFGVKSNGVNGSNRKVLTLLLLEYGFGEP